MSLQKTSKTAGGLAKIWILRLRNFKGYHFNPITKRYNLGDVRSFLEELYFTPDTAGYTVKQKYPAYNIKVNAIIPGTDITIDAYLREFENEPFIIVALNSNRQYLLFGDAYDFFIYLHDQDSGSDLSDRSQYQFSVSATMMVTPRFIDDPFIIISPSVSDVFISGVIKENETVTGMYTYTDPLNIVEGASVFRFYISDDEQDTNVEIVSQLKDIVVTEGAGDKYIRFSVIAVNAIGLTSAEVFSPYYKIAVADVAPADPPVITNVAISGTVQVDETVTGTHDYSDPSGLPEDGSIMRFYISDNTSGLNRTLVHVGETYTIPSQYEGKELQHAVIGRNSDGVTSAEVFSPFYHIDAVPQQQPPTALNVVLTGDVETYGTVGIDYVYSDPANVPQKLVVKKFYIADDQQMTNITPVSTSETYDIPYGYAEKYMIPSVIVVNNDGLSSDEVFGTPVLINRVTLPPEITNVEIIGPFIVGETASARYNYSDPNGLPEGGSDQKFWIAENDSGLNAEVEGYGMFFNIDGVFAGKYIRFSVVGCNSEGVNAAEVFTDWHYISDQA